MLQLTAFETYTDQLKVLSGFNEEFNDMSFKHSLSALQEYGLPYPKHEEWKYFPLIQLLKKEYIPASKGKSVYQIQSFQPYVKDALHVLMVNGIPLNLESVQDIKGLEIGVRKKDKQVSDDPKLNPFPHLNRVMSHEELYIRFNSEYTHPHPLHIIHVADGNPEDSLLISPSIDVYIEENVKASILETFHTNSVSEVLINTSVLVETEAYSELHHIIVESSLGNGVLIYNCHSNVRANATVQDHVIVHDSNAVRNTITGSLAEEYATYNIYGVVSGDKNSITDNHTVVDHIAPNCESNELYKHVLSGTATAVFNGKIFVRRDAQKTNAYQSNRTLLMSPTSSINTKPQLEIFADDVKCSHGATTGSVDEEALYYLRARGISKQAAMSLLTEAFIGEVIRHINYDPLRSYFENSSLLGSGNKS
ncbi:MAG: Fe-S cluster assembly protein SufD [Candidatus Kapaibacteriota bacterium]